MNANTRSKASIKEKAVREFRELVVLTAYLYVAFGAITLYKYAVLQGVGVSGALWGIAIIKAVLVAKFILISRAARIGDRFLSRPLIWTTLYRSAITLLVVLVLTAIEEAIVALFHGRPVLESVSEIGGGTPLQLAATMLLVFFIFFPYFAVESLGEVLGEGAMLRLFFKQRQELRVVEETAKQN